MVGRKKLSLSPGKSTAGLVEARSSPDAAGKRLVGEPFGLIEAPLWDPAHGLYFSDVINGGVYLRDLTDKLGPVVPKRRGVSGIALHAQGGLILSGRDVAHVSLERGETRTLLARYSIPGATGFDDLTTDLEGRIYIGSLAFSVFDGDAPKPGYLHIIDLDGTMRTISDGVLLSGGLAFSPDGRRLYHCDGGAALVRVYEVNVDGTVKPWQPFASDRAACPMA